MKVAALDHINIIADSLEDTAQFYAEVLGLERGDAPPPMTPQTAIWMLDSESRPIIHINARDCPRFFDRPVEAGSATGAVHHVALKCSGYDAVLERLDARGAQYQRNLAEAINLRQIFTHDPNNVLLELNFFGE